MDLYFECNDIHTIELRLFAIKGCHTWIFLVLLPVTIANPDEQFLNLEIFAGFLLMRSTTTNMFNINSNAFWLSLHLLCRLLVMGVDKKSRGSASSFRDGVLVLRNFENLCALRCILVHFLAHKSNFVRGRYMVYVSIECSSFHCYLLQCACQRFCSFWKTISPWILYTKS